MMTEQWELLTHLDLIFQILQVIEEPDTTIMTEVFGDLMQL